MSRLGLISLLESESGADYFNILPFDDTRKGKKKCNTFLKIEFTLFTCHTNGLHEWLVKDFSVLFEGWETLILPEKVNIDDFRRLRLLLNQFQNNAVWEKALKEYESVEEKYRLYTISKEGRLEERKVKPVCCSERTKYYKAVLRKRIPRVEIAKKFGEFGETLLYDRPISKKQYAVHMPENLIPRKVTKRRNRRKKRITIPANADWKEIGQRMDKVLQKNGYEPSYEKRLDTLNLKSLKNQTEIVFSDIIHILGGLGAGKSTWMVTVTYELVTKKKIKAGFIETSVPNVLKRAEEFRALGLKVATIIGKSDRRRHEQERLSSTNLSIEKVANDHSFEDISSLCLVEALANDETNSSDYPCQRLYRENAPNTALLCPIASHCGIYKQLAMLDQADVWIATPGSLLCSSVPKNLRKDNPSIYELFYEELDIVFVDEADAIQKTFDEQFINDFSLLGDGGYLIEDTVRKVREAIHGLYEPGGDFITTYARKCDALADSARNLFQVILESPKLKRKLKNSIAFKRIWHKKVIEKASKLFSSEIEANKLIKALKAWNENPFRGEKVWEGFPGWIDKIEQFLDRKMDLVSFLGTSKKLSKHEVVEIEGEWRFYLWLCRLEASFAYITNNYPDLLNYVPELDLDLPFTMKRHRLLPHLPTPVLGYKYGYRLVEDSHENKYVFKLIEYSTVGRTLLYRMPDLFMYCGEKKGLAVVLLSGTTLAPLSTHYSLPISYTWLLTSNKKASVLDQEVLPLVDDTGNYIRVSGQPIELREMALRQIATQLPSLINEEWISWKRERGVLLVSNSYRDSLTLIESKHLENENWSFKSLTRDMTYPDVQITHSQLEEVAMETDVLLAPISAMNRGVNLLGSDKKAKYGTAYFLSRPYPPPDDISYILSYIHSIVPNIKENIREKGLKGKEALFEFQRHCNGIFSRMYAKPSFWSSLDDFERSSLAWYLFVPIWQMIGRLVRGGVPARVVYIDKSFTSDSDVSSLLETWYQMFLPHKEEKLYKDLYGPFIDSLEKLIQEEKIKKELEFHDQ